MKHIAILGCGQLARLTALAGIPIDIEFTFIAFREESTTCVESLGRVVRWNPQEPVIELLKALGEVDAITVEQEDIDGFLLQAIDKTGLLFPSAEVLLTTRNCHSEKQLLAKLGIPVAPWMHVSHVDEADRAVSQFGYPMVFKPLERSYDKCNQLTIADSSELAAFKKQMQSNDYFGSAGWVVEPEVDVIAEISLISVRSRSGEIAFYPLTENEHKEGVLHSSIAPADIVRIDWHVQAQRQVRQLMAAWQYVGVMVTEFFLTEGGLLVNKISPRVHNCGHWTEQGAKTSQFENHLLAILDKKLGSPQEKGIAAMVNIIGGMNMNISLPGVDVHLYNKQNVPGHKLGHANLLGKQRDDVLSQMKLTSAMLRSA